MLMIPLFPIVIRIGVRVRIGEGSISHKSLRKRNDNSKLLCGEEWDLVH